MPEKIDDMDYQAIFNSAPNLFLVLRPDAPVFTILDANDMYLASTQTKRNDICGRGIFDVFPDNPDDPQANGVSKLRDSLDTVVETKQQHIMPVLRYDVQSEGSESFTEKYWNPKNAPVFNKDNELIYILHQVEDVTSLIQLENNFREEAELAAKEIEEKSMLLKENQNRINSILNALLKFTTMDFSEKLVISDKGDELDAIAFGLNAMVDELENQLQLLKRFNKDLEEANQELDSFSYSVSHDLRTPLRAISGYSQIVMEDYGDKLDEEGKKFIGVILKNASKMGMLIDDLLTFSRLGKQNLSKVTLNMHNIVESVVRDLSPIQEEHRTEITIEALENVEGDNSMIKQVFINLISNALKYSGKKEKSVISIGCYNQNSEVVFFVKDNGAGFDMKYYDKLFGVFQRLHSSSEFEGTGVGLALVARVISRHKGKVWADSKPGEGATFYFSLPVEQTDLKIA